ncbi:MAG: efflux RND transporter periplasmic adaptor subunit [Candidatus Latescibacterota bacterium]|nr:efflux RND transporter periplasmic adaptor subunit [Candidatus Latescibacterota bacterium]
MRRPDSQNPLGWLRFPVALAVAVALSLSLACGGAESSNEEGEGTEDVSDSTAADAIASDSTLASADSANSDSAAKKIEAVPVEVSQAIRGAISSYLLFSSTLETEEAVEIHPEASGRVVRLFVEEGDQVGADQVLVQLEDEQPLLEDKETEVELSHLEGSFKRTEEMFQRKLISNQEYEDALYQLEQARLRRERARIGLAHTRIRAPFSGVITSRLVQVGARVAPGAKLFDLIKLEDMIVRVYVPGKYLRIVNIGQAAEVESDFLEDMLFDGYVKRISPVVDPRSGTFKVTVGLQDEWEYLRPGIFVNVRIVTDTHEQAVLVPKEAVIYDGGDRFVFVVDDSTASKVRLQAGYENSRFVEALAGIEHEASVVVVGQNGLKDQVRVKVVNVAAATGTAATDETVGQG